MAEDSILVSVSCRVYNHGKFLRKTLEGFVNQKTDFRYQIVIHDDASTDDSAEIIREYVQKYPKLFIPVYQTENQYSQNIPISQKYIYPLCTGKYLALCEGDDYWCDVNKLQMQVDYMERHPECSMCVHDTLHIDAEGRLLGSFVNGKRQDCDLSPEQIIRANAGLFQTSSFLARSEIIKDIPEDFSIPGIGDYPIAIYASVMGKVHYIGKAMSCYRISHAGSWSVGMRANKDRLLRQTHGEYQALVHIDEVTGHKYSGAFLVAKGARLTILYQFEYGIGKLLIRPAHWLPIAASLLYRVYAKIRRLVYKKLTSAEISALKNES